MIVDNLKVNRAKPVQDWVPAHCHEIELCYLPAYTRLQSRRVRLNNDLKHQLRPQLRPASKDELFKDTRRRAARHPALARPDPKLFHAQAGPLRGMRYWGHRR